MMQQERQRDKERATVPSGRCHGREKRERRKWLICLAWGIQGRPQRTGSTGDAPQKMARAHKTEQTGAACTKAMRTAQPSWGTSECYWRAEWERQWRRDWKTGKDGIQGDLCTLQRKLEFIQEICDSLTIVHIKSLLKRSLKFRLLGPISRKSDSIGLGGSHKS